MEKINGKQAGIMCFISVLANKLILLPSLIYIDSENGALATLLLCLFIDFVFLLLILKYFKKNKNVEFVEILKNKLGKVLCRIVLFLFLCYFLIKCVILSNECYAMFRETVFAEAPLYLFLTILLVASNILAIGNFCANGRTAEFFFKPLLLAMIFIIIQSFFWIFGN